MLHVTTAENLRFLSRQGVAIRGDGNESGSNFHQLLLILSADNPELAQWLDKKKDKYTSPEIQNEVLKVMAILLSRSIVETVRSCKLFVLISEEEADVSIKKQVVVYLRYVDNDFAAREEFIGIHQVASIQSDVLILFGVLGQCVLQHTDNVRKTLQCPSLSATGAHSCASLNVSTLQGLKNNEAFVSSGKMCFNTSPAWELRHPNSHGSVDPRHGWQKPAEKLFTTALRRHCAARNSSALLTKPRTP